MHNIFLRIMVEKKEWKSFVREKIFDNRYFNIFLTIIILISVFAVILESIDVIKIKYYSVLVFIEWFFTILFTFEYFLRIFSSDNKARYIFSFFGFIDLLSILPLYLSFFFNGNRMLQVIRLLRLTRFLSRFIRLADNFDDLTNHIFSLKHHLTSDESLLEFFTRSRKSRLFSYIFAILFLILSLFQTTLNIISPYYVLTYNVVSIISYCLLFFSMFWILKLEVNIWSTRYAITNRRIFCSSGIFNENFMGVNYQYIININLNQSFWDKILGIGTIIINSAGGGEEDLKIIEIDDPIKIKDLMSKHIVKYK